MASCIIRFKALFIPLLLVMSFLVSDFALSKLAFAATEAPTVCNKNDVCEATENRSNCPSDCSASNVVSPEVEGTLNTIWSNRKDYFINSINSSFSETKRNPYNLYNVQIGTQNLLRYAIISRNQTILNDFAQILLAAYDYTTVQDNYLYYWPWESDWSDEQKQLCYTGGPDHNGRFVPLPLAQPARMWTYLGDATYADGFEQPLPSVQFLLLASTAINGFLNLDAQSRTADMNDAISKYSSMIISDHYMRWLTDHIFQVKGWGCEEKCTTPNYNDLDFLRKKKDDEFGSKSYKAYCNAMDDSEMQLLAGIAEILGANAKDSELVPITTEQKSKFLSYVQLGTDYLKSRITKEDLLDWNGQYVQAAILDKYAWDQHDQDYSGYTGSTFPTEADKATAAGTSWDISHARRIVFLLMALYENRYATGIDYPTDEVMTDFDNQIAYKLFNNDFDKPLFSNFSGGPNGWYRVGYSGRAGFGYPPSSLSDSIAIGGYNFWSKFSSDFSKIVASIWRLLMSSDQKYADLRGDYGAYYVDSKLAGAINVNKTNSLDLLNFLPSLASTSKAAVMIDNKKYIPIGKEYSINLKVKSFEEGIADISAKYNLPQNTTATATALPNSCESNEGSITCTLLSMNPLEERTVTLSLITSQ